MAKLFPTVFKMSIECPEMRDDFQGKAYEIFARILRLKGVPKVVPIGQEVDDTSDDQTRYDFYFSPSESPRFQMLFNPKRFDLASITLGVIGIITLEVIAGLIVYWIRG